MSDDVALEISKEELRGYFDKFMRREYGGVIEGEMCEEKEQYYIRIGIFYHFTDELFKQRDIDDRKPQVD